MSHINLDRTHQLHEQLIACWRERPEAFDSVCSDANRELQVRRVTFERSQTLPVVLTALAFTADDVTTLRHIAETLHTIIETALDWLLASSDRLQRYFADHQRVFPYLTRTRGLETWQGYARYDAVVTPDGCVKIIEVNSACPAGFVHSENFSQVTKQAIESLPLDLNDSLERFGTIPSGALIDELLAIEAKANVPEGLVALINDENGLLNELDLIAESFQQRGRTASIVNAAELELHGDRVYWQGHPISLTFNKVRVSTENSSGWNWKAGFEDRYAGFLAGMCRGAMASVNNLCSLTIGEDKSLLGMLLLPEFQSELRDSERDFIAEHILWTTRLEDGPVVWGGRTIDLLPYVREHRELFVIKPANEGRGFRVVIGKYVTDEEWQAACQIDENLPCVVQEYCEPCRLPVVLRCGDGVEIVDMFLTVALAVIRGRYRGLFSRVSSNPVTNVGRKGFLQAVFVTGP